ncbi:MAG: hypothetical protein JSV03_12235, partial [Planctomycetota bacterium]
MFNISRGLSIKTILLIEARNESVSVHEPGRQCVLTNRSLWLIVLGSVFFLSGCPLEGNGLLDTDDDDLSDVREIGIGTDPANPDTDGDRFSDGYEVRIGSDPLRGEDSDDDGLPDDVEEVIGSDPSNPDSDED